MIWSLFDVLGSIMPAYFVGVGALCLAAAAWLFARRLGVVIRGRRARGTIVSWERQRDTDHPGSFHYFPHVRYLDNLGKWRETRIDMGFSSERWPVGATFIVRFDPRNPGNCYAANPLILFAGPVAFAVLGAAGLYAGLTAFK